MKNKLLIGLLLVAQVSGVMTLSARYTWTKSQVTAYNLALKKLSPDLKAKYNALIKACDIASKTYMYVHFGIGNGHQSLESLDLPFNDYKKQIDAADNAYNKSQHDLYSFERAHGLLFF